MSLEIVDGHVHIWETDAILYPAGTIPASLLHPGPTAETLLREMEAQGVSQAVLVQHSSYEFDNRYIAKARTSYPGRFAGVVCIDVMDSSAPQRLETWAEEYGLRGLRVTPFRILQGDWLRDQNFYPLWEKAAELSIPVCFQGGRGWLDKLCHLLEPLIIRFPELHVGFDHMGHFKVEKGIADPAFQALVALAKYENVFVKISGHYAISHEPYPYIDTWPFMEAIYRNFSSRRMVWGSDFPYILSHCTYRENLELVQSKLLFLSDDDREWILGKTASLLWSI